jgi:hypothetical protein
MVNNKEHLSILTSEQKIDTIINALENYNLGDIIKSRKENIMIASFILCGCFIDHVSRYRYFTLKGGDRAKWLKFVDNYFPDAYKGMGEELYYSLRSSLVHNYSTNGRYSIGNGAPEKNNQPYNNKTTYLDIDAFINDILFAWDKYRKELRCTDELKKIAISHYDMYPIMWQLK